MNHSAIFLLSLLSMLFQLGSIGCLSAGGNEKVIPLEGAARRWSSGGQGGVPSFTKHVVPLLTRTGCNNRSCHGAFQGKGDFRLSLFGYEPDVDHRGLTEETRIDPRTVDESLILLKPLGRVAHGGKKRLEEGSWQHRLFREWIAGGASYKPGKEPTLQGFEIVPAEIRLTGERKKVQLQTVATFSDGSREDATALTVFSSNDDSVAKVSDDGQVASTGPGSTSIVAKYGSGIVTAQIIVPTPASAPFPTFPPSNNIDVLVENRLRELGIHPSDLCSDQEFLRRAHVDLIGTLPTAAEARAFLDDGRPDRRERLIENLLARPEYGIYWATHFSDWLGNNQGNVNNFLKMTWLFHSWLRDKLERNVPYNEIATGIITATSREGRSLEEYLAENKEVSDRIAPREGFDLETYARRKTLDLFWLRRVPDRPKELAIRSANALLGVQIQCAECHNHPFDRWTKDDFEGFTSFFRAVDIRDLDGSPRSGGRYDYDKVALYAIPADRERGMLKRHPPKILGGPVVACEEGIDPRVALSAWMTSPDNPYFARNIVNRLWHHYFGVGLVDPVDDLNEANPPSNPALLEWLARDFIDHGHDLKHLHRRILNSRTYQLSYRPNGTNRADRKHFSHALVRRMPAEVALDALAQVTGTTLRWNGYAAPRGARAIGMATPVRTGNSDYFMQIFGRPERQQTCACERSNQSALAQALFMLNDFDIHTRVGDPAGTVARLLKQLPEDEQLIEELYLTCFARYPTRDEAKKILAHVARSSSRREAFEDVLWSLMNTREFLFVK